MQTRRAVLTKRGEPDFFCEVGCPVDDSTAPYQYVLRVDELYVRSALADQHDANGRICAYRFAELYEI